MRGAIVVVAFIFALPCLVRTSHGQDGRKLEHPYLFFRASQLEQIRARFRKPPQSHYVEALVRQAKRDKGADTRLWAYILTGETEHRDRCLRWAAGEWDREDFSEEWIGFKVNVMAQVYDALHPELDDEQKARMQAYLERALDAHLRKMGSWFYNNPSNTVPSQGGAAGMAALALLWESPKAPKAVVSTRKKLARYAARCFAPDGGYSEGTLYWSFGGSFYLGFAHADHNTTGNNDLLSVPALRKQYRFAETMLGGDGQFMTFNDTQPWLCAWAVCADVGRRFDNDLMLWLSDYMAAVQAGEVRADIHVGHNYEPWPFVMMVQGDRAPSRSAGRRFPGVPTLSVLEHIQWGVMRSSGDYIPDLVVGVKGSQGQLSHHKHQDCGSFVLYAGGQMLLLDPGYFNGKADSHTVPLVNGQGPKHSGSRIAAAWEDGPWRAMAVDSTRAYRKTAQRVRRTLVMHGDRAVVVLDDIHPADGNGVTAQYQAAHAPQIDADGSAALIEGDEVSLGLWTFGPDLKMSATRRDFGKSWGFKKLAERGRISWHSLTGDYEADPENPLVTVLIPAGQQHKPPQPRYDRQGGSIEISLPDGATVRFALREGLWAFVRPDDAPPERPSRHNEPEPSRQGSEDPAADKPAPVPSEPEDPGAAKLSLARSYLANRMRRKGMEVLREVVEEHPDSSAFEEAQRLLRELEAEGD